MCRKVLPQSSESSDTDESMENVPMPISKSIYKKPLPSRHPLCSINRSFDLPVRPPAVVKEMLRHATEENPVNDNPGVIEDCDHGETDQQHDMDQPPTEASITDDVSSGLLLPSTSQCVTQPSTSQSASPQCLSQSSTGQCETPRSYLDTSTVSRSGSSLSEQQHLSRKDKSPPCVPPSATSVSSGHNSKSQQSLSGKDFTLSYILQ
jgi:hypothetical protein